MDPGLWRIWLQANGARRKYRTIGVQLPVMRWTPRVTVAAVIEKRGQFLIVEETQENQTVINQPAGHLEKGESLHAAIIREVLEETAWQFTPEAIIGIYRWPHPEKDRTYLRICYTGFVDNHDPQRGLDKGIIDARWLRYDEIISRPLRSPLVKRCFEDYISGIRYPLNICNDLAH